MPVVLYPGEDARTLEDLRAELRRLSRGDVEGVVEATSPLGDVAVLVPEGLQCSREAKRIARLAATAAAAVAAGFCAEAAPASAPRQHTFDAGVASCFVPTNVYGGTGATITAPSATYTNGGSRVLRVKAFAIIVDESSGRWIRTYFSGVWRVQPHARAVVPEVTLDLDFRGLSNYFPAGVRVRLEVYRKGLLRDVWTGVPSRYATYTNGAFSRTFSGMNSFC